MALGVHHVPAGGEQPGDEDVRPVVGHRGEHVHGVATGTDEEFQKRLPGREGGGGAR
ncbi:hypothetical protein GCM10010307_81700 [Streptomyces vastus]|uniref:Uncharacterized protein n=1 Tax=Streptomyces vastus TaxID=285451 RepID=A0ABP6EAX5_9ACTN